METPLKIDTVLRACINMEASDVHLSPGRKPILRIDGALKELETIVLQDKDTAMIFKSIASESKQIELGERKNVDFSVFFEGLNRVFRVAAYKSKHNATVIAMRLVPNKIMTFEEIGLPNMVKPLCDMTQGLFLVTGPTGSGKTTTLATMIDYINSTRGCNIVTMEDPIEYYHPHKKAIVNQREIGTSLGNFLDGVRSVLRQDPDVILIGELRDLETMSAALRAAETGHLVFSTLHTRGCSSTINRIIDVFPPEQQAQIQVQLSSCLIAVLSQTLCKRAAGKGRVAAFEFMYMDDAIRNYIRTDRPVQIDSHIQTHTNKGMQLLDEHLFRLFMAGVIGKEETLFRARDRKHLETRILEHK